MEVMKDTPSLRHGVQASGPSRSSVVNNEELEVRASPSDANDGMRPPAQRLPRQER
jgi:hypothetical protein